MQPVDPELLAELRRRHEAQIAREPKRALDDLAHIFAGDPGEAGYLAIPRDLVSSAPAAAEQAAVLAQEPALLDGLRALVELYDLGAEQAIDPAVSSAHVLRFAQGVAASRLLAPHVKSSLLSDAHQAVVAWVQASPRAP
jgi:hypothetical protein